MYYEGWAPVSASYSYAALVAVTVQPKHLDAFIEDMVAQSNSGRTHTAFLFMAWVPGDDFVAHALQSGHQVCAERQADAGGSAA